MTLNFGDIFGAVGPGVAQSISNVGNVLERRRAQELQQQRMQTEQAFKERQFALQQEKAGASADYMKAQTDYLKTKGQPQKVNAAELDAALGSMIPGYKGNFSEKADEEGNVLPPPLIMDLYKTTAGVEAKKVIAQTKGDIRSGQIKETEKGKKERQKEEFKYKTSEELRKMKGKQKADALKHYRELDEKFSESRDIDIRSPEDKEKDELKRKANVLRIISLTGEKLIKYQGNVYRKADYELFKSGNMKEPEFLKKGLGRAKK